MSVPDHPLIPDTETRLSVLLNRIHVLGKVEGVTVVAERIDFTEKRVWLHARAVPNSSTEQLTTEFWGAGQRWRHVQQAQGWEAAEEPPRGPGEMMTRVEVTLTKNGPGVNFDRQLSVGGIRDRMANRMVMAMAKAQRRLADIYRYITGGGRHQTRHRDALAQVTPNT
jgi:hypothetical protein